MIVMMRIPSKIYYCPRHNTVKDKRGECAWYYANGRCMAAAARGASPNGCNAIELVTIPKDIKASLINEIDSLLERYENASPPMDRTKFAVKLIEKAREL